MKPNLLKTLEQGEGQDYLDELIENINSYPSIEEYEEMMSSDFDLSREYEESIKDEFSVFGNINDYPERIM